MAKCLHFPQCGGCSLLNRTYKNQLSEKQNNLQSLFSNWNLEVSPIIESPQPLFYRHKVQLPFGFFKRSGGIVLGCYGCDSHKVINQTECVIQDKTLSKIAWTIREWATENRLSVYNEKTGTGFLRHVLLRKGAGTGEVLIGLVTNGEKPRGSRYLAQKLLEMTGQKKDEFKPVVGIVQNVNKRQTNVVLGEKQIVWWGRPFLKEKLGGLKFKIELSTFFQVNPYQLPRLYNRVLENIDKKTKVLDLYSGIGSIALWISSKAQTVLGIEENPFSVKAARISASVNNVKNVSFVAGDVAKLLPQYINFGFECAVVDPPRKGLDTRVLETVKNSGLKTLIYVSCNPETLFRDMEYLKHYYKPVSVTGVDMFPQTGHIECVVVANRIK
ncbi:MAG: 23S rRNA (uracil(1939)-C(5))-methyltransferase RlmD [Fibrobacter sp.]|nr:23S rRNA (uracil(1939)-C(5))-methyltransferase RlmD [Fibrobacter sp.]